MRYPQVVKAISESPWAILPEKLAAILDVIEFRADGGRLTDDEIRARVGEPEGPQARLVFMTEDGLLESVPFDTEAAVGRSLSGGAVAVLPLFGTIFPRANLFTSFSGGTTATGFQAMFSQALNDPDVGSILIEVDSPGGATDMIPETAAMVRQARGQKPIVAIANTTMASAAYYIGVQADEVVATPSSHLGSIGVIGFHTDVTEAEERAGIKTTAIFAGKYKSEGWPTTPLTDEAIAARQGIVDQIYNQFVGDVAKARGVSAADVRDGYGQGRIVSAKDAVSLGMADRMDTLDATISRMARGGARPGAKARAEALANTITVSIAHGIDARAVAASIASANTNGTAGSPAWETFGVPADEPEDSLVPGAERLLARAGVRDQFNPKEVATP